MLGTHAQMVIPVLRTCDSEFARHLLGAAAFGVFEDLFRKILHRELRHREHHWYKILPLLGKRIINFDGSTRDNYLPEQPMVFQLFQPQSEHPRIDSTCVLQELVELGVTQEKLADHFDSPSLPENPETGCNRASGEIRVIL